MTVFHGLVKSNLEFSSLLTFKCIFRFITVLFSDEEEEDYGYDAYDE